MTSFIETFCEPVKDYFGDSGFALDGSYSKEEAVEMFKETAAEFEDHFDPKEVGRGYAHFHGNWDDCGEWINGWWWQEYKTGNRGEQELWLSYVSKPDPLLDVQSEKKL